MSERAHAIEVADWIERELPFAKETGNTNLLRRPFIQNVELIIKALREYGSKNVGIKEVTNALDEMVAEIQKMGLYDTSDNPPHKVT